MPVADRSMGLRFDREDAVKEYSKPFRRMIRGKRSKSYYTYELDTVTKARRRVNLHATSLEAARERRRQLELDDARGQRPKENARLADAAKAWIELKRPTMTPMGLRAYAGYLSSLSGFLPPSITVREIEPRHIERYFKRRVLEVSRSTLNKQRMAFKQFFTWAFENALTDDQNPVRTVKRYREEKQEIRALDEKEQRKLLEACRQEYKVQAKGRRNASGRFGGKRTAKDYEWKQAKKPPAWLYPLVFAALRTGLRLGSLLALDWSEVDFRRREIRLPPRKMKSRRAFFLPLDEETLRLLSSLKKKTKGLLVFDAPDSRGVGRAFKAAVKRAGIRPCRFHSLRSTFISSLCRAGIGIEVVARLADHADVSTTARFYREIREDELREAIGKCSPAGEVK